MSLHLSSWRSNDRQYRTWHDEETGAYYVKGEWASKNEYNTALALDSYRIDYRFQYPIRGGRNVAGGFVVDFIIVSGSRYIRPTPLEVFGEYWHSGLMGSEDNWKLAMLQNLFQVPPIVLWGSDTETYEDARASVRNDIL